MSNLPDGCTDADVDKAFGYPEPDWDWVENWTRDNFDEFFAEKASEASLSSAVFWLKGLKFKSEKEEVSVVDVTEWWKQFEFDADLLSDEELFERGKADLLKYPEDNKTKIMDLYTKSIHFYGKVEDDISPVAEQAYWDYVRDRANDW